ncbi:MAG: gliding motility-associated C-terminal domain-containing protein [Bacteroidetes bacterium]|nr:gliding motility-associated C-terminal domain-containing protein [Bacteroidota bacterium]
MKRIFSLVLILFIIKNTFSQVNLSQGLVAYYPFSGNTLDASGNNNNATNFGATLTADQWGNPNSAYLFNGISDYMSVANNATLQMTSITLCARVKPNAFYPGLCYNNSIFDRGNGGFNSGSFSLVYTPTLNQNPQNYCYTPDTLFQNYRINVNNSATPSLACITPINAIPYVTTNNWDCVIGVYDNATSTGSIYVNGVFRYSYSYANGIGGTNNNILYIGGTTNPTYPYYVNGVLDELRIYNRALNIQEIDSLCNFNPNAPIILDTIDCDFTFQYPNICDSTIIQFNDLSNAINCNIISWNWDFGDGNTSNLQNPIHNYLNSGTYNVKLIVTNNFLKTDSLIIPITVLNNMPIISAIANPPSVCPGNSTVLTGSGGVTYVWSGGITNGVPFIPLGNSSYTVTGTDANGCTNTSSVTVTLNQNIPITIIPTDPLICIGDSVQLTASGALNYTWANTPGLNTYTGSSVWAYPVLSSTYTVTGTDANGCTGTSSVFISISSGIDVQVTKNKDAECNINIVQLQASGAQNYTWSPANLVNTPTGSLVNATVLQTTTFYVTGNTGSCVDIDSITVYYFNNDETGIIIPNVFSPNNDGLNDCLKVIQNARFTDYYFTIYNRWGEKVFETDDPNACWNGEHKNQPAEMGTYGYFLKAETSCGKIFKKGDITLLR